MEEFLRKIKEEKKENTFLSYRRDLSALFSYFGEKPLASLSSRELEEYFSRLARNVSRCSFSRSVCVARQYFAFLKQKGIISENPMASLRAGAFRTFEKALLSPEDFARLISHPVPGIRGRRDQAMLMLLCETGIGVSELVAVDREDVLFSEGVLLCGKESRKRSIPLSAETLTALQETLLLSRLKTPEESALFLGSTGKRMTRQGFWKNLKERALACGIENCTPVVVRHSLAHHKILMGEERKKVQALLGNRDDALLRKYEKQRKGMK